ncbi:hypothetical protein PENSPDRAFT_743395 [Peniophora sp. CONT]|nr:hypothetical protein PENSPDRAFT_743395 [Peniophora sp. CONT]
MSYTRTKYNSQIILLHPRPLAREPGTLLLVPLLPERPPPVHLPFELWSRVIFHVLGHDGDALERLPVAERRKQVRSRWQLLRVCKSWTEIAKPLLYQHLHVFTLSSLDKLVTLLYRADQKWDSIRRIPHPPPNRWVRSLDVSAHSSIPAAAMAIDLLLARIFPLLPYLERLALCPDYALSRSALVSLGEKEGLERLKSLMGFKVVYDNEDRGASASALHPAFAILRRCGELEQLEVVNDGGPPAEEDFLLDLGDPEVFPEVPSLKLPKLTSLYLQTPSPTPIVAALLRAYLPVLRQLMITPYSDSPCPTTAALLAAHGTNLNTLHLQSPKHWGTVVDSQPSTLLITSPHLRQLSLEYPLPMLALPVGVLHPLQMLTIPGPNARFLHALEVLLPRLPAVRVVRVRVSSKALEAGVQGEMRQWRRRLARKNIRFVDADGKDPV